MIARVVLALLLAASAAAQTHAIDPENSRLTVHVFKGGFFSAFGHNHEVRAPIASGSVTLEPPAVEFLVDARQLTVLDPDLKPSDRAEVQATMHSPKVLDSAQFPQIHFRSTSARREGPGWVVEGELTLHGVTRPLTVRVTENAGRYAGSVKLRQRDFGIQPVSVAGGTVKVKDEVRLDFEVATR